MTFFFIEEETFVIFILLLFFLLCKTVSTDLISAVPKFLLYCNINKVEI